MGSATKYLYDYLSEFGTLTDLTTTTPDDERNYQLRWEEADNKDGGNIVVYNNKKEYTLPDAILMWCDEEGFYIEFSPVAKIDSQCTLLRLYYKIDHEEY